MLFIVYDLLLRSQLNNILKIN